MREVKTLPSAVKDIKGNFVTGIFSVFGNVDDYNDRIWPGAFTKTLLERSGRIHHLWQHDFASPPIAKITSIREVSRDELPDEVLRRAPEALGGAEVTREYFDTPRAQEVLTAIKAGTLEMSFAYDPIKYDYEELPGAKYEWERLRNLREVRLYETSDVLWGANDATVASKSLQIPFDFLLKQLLAQLSDMQEQIKGGARHSAADIERINQIAQLAIDLGATNIKLLDEQLANDPALNDDGSKRAEPQPAALTLSATAFKYRLQSAERALALLSRSV